MKFTLQDKSIMEITTLIVDLNGTLAVKGIIPAGVKERIAKLTKLGYNVILVTGNQRGNAEQICSELGVSCMIAKNAEQKENAVHSLNADNCGAIGNSRIDIPMFKHAKVAVATLQAEGIHTGILNDVDIIVPSINDALDLFIDADSLVATLKK